MVSRTADESAPNLNINRGLVRERESGGYVVKIKQSQSELVSAVVKPIDEVDIYGTNDKTLNLTAMVCSGIAVR